MRRNSAMLGSVELLVTPEQMYRAADLIEKNIQSSKNAFTSMISDIQKTSAYWEGDAAEKERKRFQQENENFSALIMNLTNYVTELKLITDIYVTSEQESTTEAMSLQSNVLS